MTHLRNIDRATVFAIFLLLLAIISSVRGYNFLHGEFDLNKIATDFYANVSSELGSIAITVLVIDQLNRRRDAKEQQKRDQWQSEEQRKRDQLQAISELEQAKTPEDRQPIINRMTRGDLFKGIKLTRLNLEKAQLDYVNLEEALLIDTNLSEARINYVRLKRTNLSSATLQGAKLMGAGLQGCDLRNANLEAADLRHANLEGAYLCFAKIEKAIWINAILPDGTERTHLTDLKRFTDHEHTEFDVTLEKINTIRKEMGIAPIQS